MTAKRSAPGLFSALIAALIIVFSIQGCNIFGFSNPVDSSTDYLAEGQLKYWDGDFDGAVIDFANAIEANPDNGDAYWWHAKALIRATGYTPILIADMVVDIDTVSSLLPFMTWSADSADVLYQAIRKINADLAVIFYDSTSSNELNSVEIAFDYAMALAIQGLLMLRDTNLDGVINHLDLNIGAFFVNGVLEINDEQWNQLTSIDKNVLIDNVLFLLDQFSDVTYVIVGEIGGYDVTEMRDLVDTIRDGLNGLRP